MEASIIDTPDLEREMEERLSKSMVAGRDSKVNWDLAWGAIKQLMQLEK